MDSADDLKALLDREKIRDAIVRLARGEDRRDAAAITAAYWPDSVTDYGVFRGSFDDYLAWVVPGSDAIKVTQHVLGQSLVELSGDTALVETHVNSYHRVDFGAEERDNQGGPQTGFDGSVAKRVAGALHDIRHLKRFAARNRLAKAGLSGCNVKFAEPRDDFFVEARQAVAAGGHALWRLSLPPTTPTMPNFEDTLVEWGGGLYWVMAGALVSFVWAVANAWVLLVEVQR